MEKKEKKETKEKKEKKSKNGFWEKFKTNYKKNGLAILLMAMVLVLAGAIFALKYYSSLFSYAANSSDNTDEEVAVTDDTDEEDEDDGMLIGDVINLTKLASGLADEHEIIDYTISNEAVVSIDENLDVTALLEGETDITIKYAGGEEETINVKVVSDTSNASSASTDRIYFLSLQRGNAILVQTTVNGNSVFGLIDAGYDNADSDSVTTCSNLVTEISNILSKYGASSLDFVMLTHLDTDHFKCLTGTNTSSVTATTNVLNNSKFTVKSVILKQYAKQSDTYGVYKRIVKYSVAKSVPVYVLSSDTSHNVTMKKASFSGNTVSYSTISGSTTGTINNFSYTINNVSNKNNSYLYFKFGNFTFDIMNIIQRDPSTDTVASSGFNENFNSLVLYGTVNSFDFYMPGDIYNSSNAFANHTSAVTSYNATTLLNSPSSSPLADYYAYYTKTQFSKGTVDLYVASHHGTTQTNNGYITKQLISSSTKVVFTFAYKYIASYSYGSKTDNSNSYANCPSYSSGSAAKFRCLNDYTVNRIMSALGTSSLMVYYQNYNASGISSVTNTLKFGFNGTSVTYQGQGTDITKHTYAYKSSLLK